MYYVHNAHIELDLSSFEVEDEEKFFEHEVRKLAVSLSGSPPTESPIARPPPPHTRHTLPEPPPSHHTSSHLTQMPQSTSENSPPRAIHSLNPSHTPHGEDHTPYNHTHSPSSLIVTSRTLILPETPVGQSSGKPNSQVVDFPHSHSFHTL